MGRLWRLLRRSRASGVKPNTLGRFDPKSESFSTKPIPSGGGVDRNMVATPGWSALSGRQRREQGRGGEPKSVAEFSEGC